MTLPILIASTFAVILIVFFGYDWLIRRRNEILMQNAARTSAIVTSLFPGTIRDKLIQQQDDDDNNNDDQGGSNMHSNMKRNTTLRSYMTGNTASVLPPGPINSKQMKLSTPLADLFLETTILFADLVGFTAWSSTREPAHVFTLLETIYSAFDEIAKARRVFKVETVGDCYVAATGMPEPRKDHAVSMCRYARDILRRMRAVTKELEVVLGPDTGDLELRIGIHSGPVTAGVLRGEKARFQLFGDTMNVTARIESNGAPGRIHISQETADLLIANGKGNWIEAREHKIQAKGKGLIQTYWLNSAFGTAASSQGDNAIAQVQDVLPHPAVGNHADSMEQEQRDQDLEKVQRLVDWNTENLLRIIKKMVAHRQMQGQSVVWENRREFEMQTVKQDVSFLDEVQETIKLPDFDSCKPKTPHFVDPDDVVLNEAVEDEVKNYVHCIESMYRPNSFHNFEHASHVTMSVLKLLARIVAPSDDDIDTGMDTGGNATTHKTLHDHTYGITSDPLTQFACAVAGLIHDVDHPGVPNKQLVAERTPLATAYKNRSVAEQNSLSLAWDLLMDDQFENLREVVYTNEVELNRFRQLVVNSVMATDIVDKDLKALRNGRWDRAFHVDNKDEKPRMQSQSDINRKATIVIEHLIQASDVAHTMQHWHIYRKWNERFFHECYAAYKNGRADADPSISWYKGEIGFFDFYIIPLAKKLKECGVFGKSSDEYLNYAVMNRSEWETRGQEIVAEMLQRVDE